LGAWAAGSVPLVMLLAFVVSFVAEAENDTPPVLDTVKTPVLVFSVPSPDIVTPPNAPELLY
jgi:hypothetical protein